MASTRPKTKRLEKSFPTGSCDLPSSTTTDVYEDTDSLKTNAIERSQFGLTGTMKPTLLPRSKSWPHPVRPPPPKPPLNKQASSCGSTTTVSGSLDNSSKTLQTLKYDNVGEIRAPQPPPPQFAPPPTPRQIKRPAVSHPSSIYESPDENAVVSHSSSVYEAPDEYDDRARTKLLEKSFPTGSCDLHSSTTIDNVYEDIDSLKDIDSLLRWLKTMPYSNTMAPSLGGLNIEDETREFNQRAMNMQKALRLYNLLLSQHSSTLQSHISALNEISGKMQKKTKTMAIAGGAGAVGALSGAAAVVGIVLAPLTMGATLALTAAAVGAGLVSAGVGGEWAPKRLLPARSVWTGRRWKR